jgi:hypothetical protein
MRTARITFYLSFAMIGTAMFVVDKDFWALIPAVALVACGVYFLRKD